MTEGIKSVQLALIINNKPIYPLKMYHYIILIHLILIHHVSYWIIMTQDFGSTSVISSWHLVVKQTPWHLLPLQLVRLNRPVTVARCSVGLILCQSLPLSNKTRRGCWAQGCQVCGKSALLYEYQQGQLDLLRIVRLDWKSVVSHGKTDGKWKLWNACSFFYFYLLRQ